ncbi:hypothetical protein [Gracilibacillus timonensis]|nr:hypothetical protein [Gracilibacillus timonensis]
MTLEANCLLNDGWNLFRQQKMTAKIGEGSAEMGVISEMTAKIGGES